VQNNNLTKTAEILRSSDLRAAERSLIHHSWCSRPSYSPSLDHSWLPALCCNLYACTVSIWLQDESDQPLKMKSKLLIRG